MAQLVVINGTNAGRKFELTDDLVTVGRTSDNGLFLMEEEMSRHHAVFYKQGKFYEVRDLNSLNGTYVNGQRVTSFLLKEDAELAFGLIKVAYKVKSDSKTLAPAPVQAAPLPPASSPQPTKTLDPQKQELSIGSVLKKRDDSSQKP